MTPSITILHDSIVSILNQELSPTHLEVIDESHMHSRQTETNLETHFKIIVVAEMFSGLTRVRRQQLVYSFLSRLFKTGLHALSQATYTPEEWAKDPKVNRSPKCAG